METTASNVRAGLAAFGGWLSKKRSPLFWRVLLSGILLCAWQFLAVIVLSGRGGHPYWWAWAEDLGSIADAPWQVVAGLSVALAGALLVPWALPAARIGPPGGRRTWFAVAALVMLVPQLWIGAKWLGAPALAPAERTLAGRPEAPMLWIIAESADAGLHLPRVDARRHDYYSVSYSLSVPSGPLGGVWAQICGGQLDAAGAGAGHRCLVDDGWSIVHGHSAPRIDALLASTGADVIGGRALSGRHAGGRDVPDAALLLEATNLPNAATMHESTSVATATPASRRHVLVLAAGTGGPLGDVFASDAAMDAAIATWLDRGGIALVTANRPRRREGWNALPARLYGVDQINLSPSLSRLQTSLGKAGPGRLMGGLRRGTLYDVGCTAWELAGFGCQRVGHGVSLSRESSITLGLFRSDG